MYPSKIGNIMEGKDEFNVNMEKLLFNEKKIRIRKLILIMDKIINVHI